MQIATVTEHASPLIERGGVDAGGRNRHTAECAATARHGHDGRHRGRRMPTGAMAMTGPSPTSPASPCHDAIGIRPYAVVATRQPRRKPAHGPARGSEPR